MPEIDRSALLVDSRALSKETPRTGCRTMDILHVAGALQIKPTVFISFDRRQRDLAGLVGLSVLPEEVIE